MHIIINLPITMVLHVHIIINHPIRMVIILCSFIPIISSLQQICDVVPSMSALIMKSKLMKHSHLYTKGNTNTKGNTCLDMFIQMSIATQVMNNHITNIH